MLSEYVIGKYAPTLTAEDMLFFFSKLVEKEGSITKAATRCNINRRSYYMLQEREFIQPNTKEKILRCAYELSPDETLEYLLKRQIEDSLEVLLVNLSKIYEEAIEESNRELLVSVLEQFNKIKDEYEGLIIDNLQREVADQIAHLMNKAEIAEVIWSPTKASILKVNEIKSIIQIVSREIRLGKNPETISDKYRISQDLVQVISELDHKKKTASLSECAGFVYGHVDRSDLEDYWRKHMASAAGNNYPTYQIRYAGSERVELQTETAYAIPYGSIEERV